MKRKLLVTLPQLNDCGGDLSKEWFVFYAVRNPQTEKMKRFRIYEKLYSKSKKERYAEANKIIKEYSFRLSNGWTPFTEELEKKIYSDQLQYKNVAKVFGNLKKNVNTVYSLLSEYLEYENRRVKPKTFESYSSKLRTFSMWLEREKLSDFDITLIENKHVLKFFDYLIIERNLAKRTLDKYAQNLNTFFEYFITRDKIRINPVFNVPKIRQIVDYSPKPIDHRDIESFKDTISKTDPQLWLAILFEYYCFIRPGTELRLMKVQWIDFYYKTIKVPALFSKNGKEQAVVIPDPFLKTMIEQYYLDKYDRNFYVFGRNGRPGADHLGKNTLRNRFNKIRDEIGFSKEYKFYSWKHTGARAASDAGIPVKDIQMQMRHHSLDVTDKYLRKLKGIDSEALKKRFPTI